MTEHITCIALVDVDLAWFQGQMRLPNGRTTADADPDIYHSAVSTGTRNDGRILKNQGLQQHGVGRFSAVSCPQPAPKPAQIVGI